MTLIRWQPFWNNFPVPSAMHSAMGRMFDDLFRGEEAASAWTPRVEVAETDAQFEVTAELPGLERDDVKISLQNNILTLSGEKKAAAEKKDHNLYLCERTYGNFTRSFQMPAQVDTGKVNAVFKNGILTLVLPKVEEAKPRQIDIKAE
jgi:HSP20 family protein